MAKQIGKGCGRSFNLNKNEVLYVKHFIRSDERRWKPLKKKGLLA